LFRVSVELAGDVVWPGVPVVFPTTLPGDPPTPLLPPVTGSDVVLLPEQPTTNAIAPSAIRRAKTVRIE
jgi:hypothetical protein